MKKIFINIHKYVMSLFIPVLTFVCASTAYSQSLEHKFVYSIGGNYGTFTGINEAISDFELSELSSGTSYGANISMMSLYNRLGMGLELSVEQYSRNLSEDGIEFGKLKMTPIVARIKLQGFPKSFISGSGVGFSIHLIAGAGISSNDFTQSKLLDTLGYSSYSVFRTQVNSSFVVDLGGGFDIFFSKFVSLSLNGLYRFGEVERQFYLITVTSQYTWETTSLEDSFNAFGGQFSAGLNFWF